MGREWRRFLICASVAIVSALGAVALLNIRFFQLLELKARDAHFVLRGTQPTKDIVIIGIDDKALNTFPEIYTFWQPYYADAIKAAADAGARVMVLDVAFAIPVAKYEPNNDAMLAEAFSYASSKMPVIAAFVPSKADQTNPAFAVPVNMLASAFGLSAMANLTDDADNFVRTQELIEAPKAGVPTEGLTRSMALRAAEKYVGKDVEIKNGRLELGGKTFPRTVTINFAGPAGTFPVISLYDFIQAVRSGNEAQLEKWVKGKVVLLGPDNMDDRHATPFFTAFSLSDKWMTPGVEIHANTLRTLLTGDFMRPAPDWVQMVALLMTTSATVLVVSSLPAVQTTLWAAVCLILAVLTSHIFFLVGWLISTTELALGFGAALIGAVAYRFATAERKSSLFKSAVALFVGKQVATSLENSRSLALTGKRQMVTILFTDIRGFTAFCESKDPAVVVDLLNDYMKTMVGIIVKFNGHVNKFIGDGILAVFSDDDEHAAKGDHARRAVLCATEMVTFEGEFKTGAGLHSGEVVIGNVGSSDKMEFTVLGDTVNLASRLESLNKENQTKLLMSDSTLEKALETGGGPIDTRYLGEVPVRGKTVPMKLYTVVLTAIFAVFCLQGAETPREEPVGLVLTAAGGKVLRSGTETPLAARAGDILFSGDSLRAIGGPANFLYCPGKSSQTLADGGEVVLDTKQLKVKAGKLDPPKPVNACFLPQLVRVAVATQQHYGVSMTRGLAKPEGEVVAWSALPANVRSELAPAQQVLRTNADDAVSLLEEAAVFDREKLQANALEAYRKVAATWKDAVWVRGRIFELEEALADQAALKEAEIAPDARTYALMIGISEYQKLPKDLWLQYADADAKTFGQHMASARGGGVPADQMVVLTNRQATTAAVRNAFQTFLKNRAGKKDTVFILIAGHGTVDSRGAYIMTYDSDPQDLSATAIPMAEIQRLVETELSKVGRVVLMADVCRAATIGNLKTAAIGSVVEKLGEAPGDMLGLMAARPRELSMEGPQYGGGHGAFTYSLLKGLQGQADKDDDRFVSAGEIIDYTRDDVSKLTNNRQHPRDFGNMENATKLSDLSKQGIVLARFRSLFDSRKGGPLFVAGPQQAALTAETTQDVDAFQAAVRARLLLPDQAGSAWGILDRLRGELPPGQLFLQQNALRVALEDEAQQVLLRYLAGDQTPQTKAEFDAGSRYMEAALTLTPESLYLEGRDSFFQGRGLLYDKQYGRAAALLEQSVRIDPGEAYGYNALGIAYLEQADFARAIPAFRDAAKRAVNWSYPLHNLALALVEAGDYNGAIRSYQQAMKLTPQYSYLPYNLGLVYQRMNRRREAEGAYRKAMALAPASAEPLNALGSLMASEGKATEAEKFYRDALAKNAGLLAARHNLALLLAGEKGRGAEAVVLWRENLTADPNYLASRLSLAEYLARTGDNAGAIEQYLAVVKDKPEYVAARVALGGLYLKTNRPAEAVEQLRAAVKVDDQNAPLWEQIGDAEKTAGNAAGAKDAYATALKLQLQKSDKKRISGKMTF
jgi:adenylate cyclase